VPARPRRRLEALERAPQALERWPDRLDRGRGQRGVAGGGSEAREHKAEPKQRLQRLRATELQHNPPEDGMASE
jgi:hypothetical protein